MQLIQKNTCFRSVAAGIVYFSAVVVLCVVSFRFGIHSRIQRVGRKTAATRIAINLAWHDICVVARVTGLSGSGHFFREWIPLLHLASLSKAVAADSKLRDSIPSDYIKALASPHFLNSSSDSEKCVFLSPNLKHLGVISAETVKKLKEGCDEKRQ